MGGTRINAKRSIEVAFHFPIYSAYNKNNKNEELKWSKITYKYRDSYDILIHLRMVRLWIVLPLSSQLLEFKGLTWNGSYGDSISALVEVMGYLRHKVRLPESGFFSFVFLCDSSSCLAPGVSDCLLPEP